MRLPPTRVARRYAAAFFKHVEQSGSLPDVEDDARALLVLYDSSPEFRTFLTIAHTSPQRKRILESVLAERCSPDTSRFLSFVVSKRRQDTFRAMIIEFLRMCDTANGIVRARVQSPFPLPESTVTKVRDFFEPGTQGHLVFTEAVDQSLLGGIRVTISDMVTDFSIAARLDDLHARMISEPIPGV